MNWLVYTPPYERYPGSRHGWEPEPPEYGSDVVEVVAKTRKQALVLGLRELRRTHSYWVRDVEGNPFNGLGAEALGAAKGERG